MDSSSLKTDRDLNLDKLPDEIYHFYLFEYLDIDDLGKLRLINKRFNSIVRSYNIQELSILNFDNYHLKERWFSTTKSTKFRDRLPDSYLRLLINPTKNLLNLKHLRIRSSKFASFTLESLNKFTKLQILDIERIGMMFKHNLLRLPDLRFLSIKIFGNSQSGIISIDAKNLHSLRVLNLCIDRTPLLSHLRVDHPLSIKYLGLNIFDRSVFLFKNLECLEVFKFSKFFLDLSLRPKDLLNFEKLNTFEISTFLCQSEHVQKVKSLFASKKQDLNFVIGGLKITEANQLSKGKDHPNMFALQLENYDKLENDLHYVNEIEYNTLLEYFPDNLPADLFEKYANVQRILIDTAYIKDEDQLLDFIKKFPNLSSLEIKGLLSQQFYDHLPEIDSLAELKLIDNAFVFIPRFIVSINFEFIMKISYLMYLETTQFVSINKNLNLNTMKYLKELKFMIHERMIRIDKEDKDRYIIKDCMELGLSYQGYFTFDELVDSLNQLINMKPNLKKRKLN